MIICETARLRLRHFHAGDAPFILRLLNEPSFLRHIGDKQVRTLDDARRYLESGPLAGYATHGHHLNCVELLATGTAIGMCGVLQRDTLPDPDLGYAFLPEYWSRGLAREAATAAVHHARTVLGLETLLAITGEDNHASIGLLEKLGFRVQEQAVRLQDGAQPVRVFVLAR